jgi:uncharacterized RDD family membrane protein YckC
LSTQPSPHLNFEPAEALAGASQEAFSPVSPLREQAATRLAAHRARRGAPKQLTSSIAQPHAVTGKAAHIAAAVAARYAKAQSYRDFLAAEAEAALRRAEAAAEIAARNAEAIAIAQQDLLRDIAHWNACAEEPSAHITEPACVEEPTSGETAIPESIVGLISEASEPAISSPDVLSIVVEHFTEMQLGSSTDFEAAPEPAAQPCEEAFDSFAFDPYEPVEPTPLPANLIEFPRVLIAPRKARPRFAEGPLRDDADINAQLRIFEVDSLALSPELAHTSATPEWSSIRLDAAVPHHAMEHPQMPASLTVPIQTAALRSRVAAFAADTALTIAATAAFAAVFIAIARHAGAMPEKKAAAVALIAVFLLFKLAYQILFFTLNEFTPGMRMARIALCTFGDENPTRKAMRRRIGATVLAACPMGLGLIWGWFDDDRLGWHDRMTRTYQRSY